MDLEKFRENSGRKFSFFSNNSRTRRWIFACEGSFDAGRRRSRDRTYREKIRKTPRKKIFEKPVLLLKIFQTPADLTASDVTVGSI